MATFNQKGQTILGSQTNIETKSLVINQGMTNPSEGLKQSISEESGNVDKLRGMVSSGEIEKCLQKLVAKKKIEKLGLLDTVLLLKARFENLNKSKMKGIIDNKEYNLEYNNIGDSILKVINHLEK